MLDQQGVVAPRPALFPARVGIGDARPATEATMRLGFGFLLYRLIRTTSRSRRPLRPQRRHHETTVQKQARLRATSPARAQAVAEQSGRAQRYSAAVQRAPETAWLRAEALARYNARRKGGAR